MLRLTYLPLNGFISAPCIQFDANEYLNYVSYPLLRQLISPRIHLPSNPDFNKDLLAPG